MPDHDTLRSTLAAPILGYIAEKRATGYEFKKGADLLRSFDAFVCRRGLQETNLTKSLVMEWTARKPTETASTQAGRISLLRGLAVYMNRLGYVAYVSPRALSTIDRYAYTPYIFSKDEMRHIFEVCDHYPFHADTPNRHLVLPLLLRILYACGLRVSEVLHLTFQDVDLHKGTLSIRYAKFNKERLLPMTDTLTERCREFVKTTRLGKADTQFFFSSPLGGHYSQATIYKLFRDVLRRAKISHLGRGKGPRIHDLRHTFAVNCLRKWVLNGKDLNNALPYLTAYLGHEDLRGSQRYLRLTADLYPDLMSKIENTCSYVIPEVKYEAD
ncbi:MAG: tyrosine-type recombinase/integrase [Dethiobacter sp.]|nr:tyrosine-type recombinase/integrase [Dethiobacter sp.]MBS4054773.1 tyrosine-type recombinase/integrase [Thermaerobacter sp.]